jgi:hypothetical protein
VSKGPDCIGDPGRDAENPGEASGCTSLKFEASSIDESEDDGEGDGAFGEGFGS